MLPMDVLAPAISSGELREMHRTAGSQDSWTPPLIHLAMDPVSRSHWH